MKQKNFLKIAMLFIFAMITHFSFGQLVTTIDFETEDDGYTPSIKTGSGNTDAFNRTDTGVNDNTSFYWVAEDLSGNPSMDLTQINVIGSTSFTFAVDFSYNNSAQWDSTDELLITYSVDGGVYQNLMAVQHINSDGYNNPAALDLDFDENGDSGQELSTSAFTTFTTSNMLLSSNSTLDIKFQFNNLTSNGEGIFIDNIVITETAAASNPTVTFDSATSNVNETDIDVVTAGIPVTFSNFTADATITPTVNASSTADAADYSIDLTPLTFTADGTLNIPLTIKDDADFLDETIIIDFTVTSGTADLELSQHTVTIIDDDLPSGSIPYSEDFSDCGTQNWTVFTVGAQQEWTCDGDGYFEANAFGSSGAADDYLVSPEFNMDGQSGETLSFTSWTQYADTTYPRIELLYTTNFTGDVTTTNWNSS